MVKSIRLSQKDNERHNGGCRPHSHLSGQTEIRATTWRMCYVAYTNRAVAVYNYCPEKEGWKGMLRIDWTPNHLTQFKAIGNNLAANVDFFLRFFCRNRSWQMVDWQLNGSHAFRFGSSQLKMKAGQRKEAKEKRTNESMRSEAKGWG